MEKKKKLEEFIRKICRQEINKFEKRIMQSFEKKDNTKRKPFGIPSAFE